ncbi:MAG: efflux transporter periplasmic adaptor subunit, partial [Acidobacteria bacterium]
MLPQSEDKQQIAGETAPATPEMSKPSYKRWLGVGIALIVVASLLISGIWSRVSARAALDREAAQAALTAVSVVSPKRTAPADEIILPGNVQPYISSPVYARTNGYLKKWYLDI